MIRRRLGRYSVAWLTWLSILVGIAIVQPPSARAALPTSVSEPIRLAKAALLRTETRIANERFDKALHSLETLRRNVRRANNAAIDQIGLPPADPESDEPPGPECVFAALKLDHRIGMRLVVLFDGLAREDVVSSLLATLLRMHTRRDAMLDAVIALPSGEDGERGAYDDGMSDTLTDYPAEEAVITTALDQYELTESARTGLEAALERVQATEAKVTAVWGGGE